jgi:hypothetical protein
MCYFYLPRCSTKLALQGLEILTPIDQLILSQLVDRALHPAEGLLANSAANLAGAHGPGQRATAVHRPRRLLITDLQVLHNSLTDYHHPIAGGV